MMSKTQILITDIATEKFSEGWPQELQKEVFERRYPDIKPEFFSPLPFLHRIVIILQTDDEAAIIYECLQEYLREDSKVGHKYKLYRTESLISRPRAKSMNDAGRVSLGKGGCVLKIDTSGDGIGSCVRDVSQEGGVINSCLSSPDQAISPTRLRLQDGQKEYFYMEPPPSKWKSGCQQGLDGVKNTGLGQPRVQGEDTGQEGEEQRTRSPSITVTNVFG